MRPVQQYSEFFWTFTWRNIKLQYSSFGLGVFWGIIQPLLMSAIFYVVLNNSVGTNFSNYFVYIYSGFIFWSVFSGSLAQGHLCFLQNDGMVKQIYFPRYLLPLTYLAAKLMDLLVAFIILCVLLLLSDMEVHFGRLIIFSLLGIIQLLLVSAGFNLLFSVTSVRYRGFQVIYPFVAQALFFTSSVIYEVSSAIENKWLKYFFEYNPFNMILSTFRSGVFPQEIQTEYLLISMAYSIIICGLGYMLFKMEDKHLIDRL